MHRPGRVAADFTRPCILAICLILVEEGGTWPPDRMDQANAETRSISLSTDNKSTNQYAVGTAG